VPLPVAGGGSAEVTVDRVTAWAGRNWLPLCALCVFVGSDYKFRRREATAGTSGALDAFILLELGLYGAVAAYLLLRRASPPRAVRLPAPMGFACAYLLVIAVSLLNTPYLAYAAARSVEMAILVGLALVVALRAERADLHRLAHGFMLLVAVSVLYGVVVPSQPLSNQQVGRFTWLAIHPGLAGAYCGIAVVVAFVYVVQRGTWPGPRWSPGVYGLLLLVAGYGLFGAHARGAVAGTAAAIFAASWSLVRSNGRRVELVLGLVGVVALAALLASQQIAEYLARGQSTEELATANARTSLWSYAFDAIADKPLYGWGAGASQGIFLDEIGLGGGHNMLINLAVDLGLVGLLVWLGLVGTTMLRVAGLPRAALEGLQVDRGLLTGIITLLLVDGFFSAGPGGLANVSSTWLILAVGWVSCLTRLLKVARTTARDRSAPESALRGR
jgi:O-antigen ligase